MSARVALKTIFAGPAGGVVRWKMAFLAPRIASMLRVISSSRHWQRIRSRHRRESGFPDQPAAEIKLDLRGAGKTDLDFLEAGLHQQLEIFELLLDAHRLGERLVAVAQIDAAPDGRALERATGPLAVGEVDGRKRTVFRDGRRLHDQEID